jgi:hypothetical protein
MGRGGMKPEDYKEFDKLLKEKPESITTIAYKDAQKEVPTEEELLEAKRQLKEKR